METTCVMELRPEIWNMLRGRFAKRNQPKKRCIWKSGVCGRILALCELVNGARGVNKHCSHVRRLNGWFILLKQQQQKTCLRSLDTLSLSALNCLFRADFPCKHLGRRSRSRLANPCGQTQPSPVDPAFIPHSPFQISYRCLPHPACIFFLWCAISQRRSSPTVWLPRESDWSIEGVFPARTRALMSQRWLG